jgi:hydroxyacylglutathione hydrolase
MRNENDGSLVSVLRITPIACLEDNYAYLLEDSTSGEAAVVDPSEAGPVLAAVCGSGRRLVAILCTHHHYDHVGGVLELASSDKGIKVYAHARDRGRIAGQTDSVEEGLPVTWGGVTMNVLHVPGHTLGAVAYAADDAVFTGDTLFSGGCGRLFEGTASMMHDSLQRLARLPQHVRVFSGHEYTEQNLRFAASLEPDNPQVAVRLTQVLAQRRAGKPTVGASLRDELTTNPFLRCGVRALRDASGVPSEATEAEVFSALRRAKDGFRR